MAIFLLSRVAQWADRPHIAAMHNEEAEPASIERSLMEGIALRKEVTAIYNGTEVRLAPHSLLSRHGALFVGALNLHRAKRESEEPRLGLFRLAGLSGVTVTDSTFDELEIAPIETRDGDAVVFSA